MATTFDFPQPLVRSEKTTKVAAPKEKAPMLEAYNNDNSSGLGLTAICAGLGIAVGIISGCVLALVHPPSPTIASTSTIVATQANVAVPANIVVPQSVPSSTESSPETAVASARLIQAAPSAVPARAVILTNSKSTRLAATRFRVIHKLTTPAAARTSTVAPSVVATSNEPATKIIPVAYEVTPNAVSNEASATPVKAVAAFSYEGDLQVVDYDGNAHSIQTSDGRTFVINATDMDNAMNLEDSRSDVHFRCAQGGSCMLKARGAAGFEATPLKTI